MRIGIIGCNGFLAKAIYRAFFTDANNFVFIGRHSPQNISKKDTFLELDLQKSEIPIELLFECDMIFFTAALGVQSKETAVTEYIYNINVFIPIKLKESLERKRYKGVFVTFGSYFEIGDSKVEKAFHEDEVLLSFAPLPNEYCISKKLLTHYIHYSHTATMMNFHFILPTIYGEDEDKERIIPYTLHCLNNGLRPAFSIGTQVRQYLHVDDAVQYIKYILQLELRKGTYNIPGPDTISIRKLVEKICHSMNVTFRDEWFGSVERRDVTMPYLALKSNYLAVDQNFSNFRSLDEYLLKIKNRSPL